MIDRVSSSCLLRRRAEDGNDGRRSVPTHGCQIDSNLSEPGTKHGTFLLRAGALDPTMECAKELLRV